MKNYYKNDRKNDVQIGYVLIVCKPWQGNYTLKISSDAMDCFEIWVNQGRASEDEVIDIILIGNTT